MASDDPPVDDCTTCIMSCLIPIPFAVSEFSNALASVSPTVGPKTVLFVIFESTGVGIPLLVLYCALTKGFTITGHFTFVLVLDY